MEWRDRPMPPLQGRALILKIMVLLSTRPLLVAAHDAHVSKGLSSLSLAFHISKIGVMA